MTDEKIKTKIVRTDTMSIIILMALGLLVSTVIRDINLQIFSGFMLIAISIIRINNGLWYE